MTAKEEALAAKEATAAKTAEVEEWTKRVGELKAETSKLREECEAEKAKMQAAEVSAAEVKATLEFSRTRKSMSVICAPKVGERTCLHRREWSVATSCS